MKKVLLAPATIIVTLLWSGVVNAQFSGQAQQGVNDVGGAGADGNSDVPTLLRVIVNTLLFLVGATSVIMIIVAGLRFIFSNGDQQQISSARNTILYSVVGLIVAVFAWGIVNWVLGQIYGSSNSVEPFTTPTGQTGT